MKSKYFLYFFILFFSLNSKVFASSISYTIINSTTPEKVSVTVNTIVKKIQYDCDTLNFSCVQTKETISERIENPLKEFSVEELEERDRLIALAKASSSVSVSTTTAVAKSEPKINKYAPFILPNNAISATKSPDGKMIAYYQMNNGTVRKYNSFVLLKDDGTTLEKFALLYNWDLITETPKLFGWTDDNKKLVYIDERGGYPQLYVVDLSKNPKNLLGEALMTKKYNVVDFIVKGNSVYFIANRTSPYVWGLYSLSLEDGKLDEIFKDVMYTNDLVFSGDNLIFTSNGKGMGVLRAYDTKNNQLKNFFGIKEDSVPVLPYKLVSKSGIKGVLMNPENKKFSKKAVIWLHGGPYRQTNPERHSYGSYATYDWMLDEMVKNGVAVLKIDYPGSMGYGIDYTKSLINKIGEVDVANVKKAIQYLKNNGVKEIYLFGNSYGGYLSAKSLVELNSSLSGAMAAAPVTDWQKLIKQVTPTPFEAHFIGTPNSKNQYLYDKASIVKRASKLTKPLILVHGELDNQVPFNQSEFLFKELDKMGKNVKYYSVVNQGHVFSGVSQNEAICKKLGEMIGVISSSTDYCVMN